MCRPSSMPLIETIRCFDPVICAVNSVMTSDQPKRNSSTKFRMPSHVRCVLEISGPPVTSTSQTGTATVPYDNLDIYSVEAKEDAKSQRVGSVSRSWTS